MGYGNPGGKSVVSKVPNVPVSTPKAQNSATLAAPKALGSGKQTAILKATDIIKNVMSPINGYTPLSQSLVNQPTRTPGGAGLNLTNKQPTSSNSPGFIKQLYSNIQNAEYVSADDPNSMRLSAQVGGTMGLLESVKSIASSSEGKALIGGGVAALTGGSKSTTTTSAGRAVNPNTGRPYRHMNSLNPHALSRATRRIKSFTKRVHTVEKALNRIHTHKR